MTGMTMRCTSASCRKWHFQNRRVAQWRPDGHCNDWPTALAPLYLRFARGRHAASLLTIHNLAFRGIFSFDQVKPLSFRRSVAWGAEARSRSSRAASCNSSAVNTAATYSARIQTHELGFDGRRAVNIEGSFGVLNGINTTMYNPQADPLIPAHPGPTHSMRSSQTSAR